jgi:hypothetical protein
MQLATQGPGGPLLPPAVAKGLKKLAGALKPPPREEAAVGATVQQVVKCIHGLRSAEWSSGVQLKAGSVHKGTNVVGWWVGSSAATRCLASAAPTAPAKGGARCAREPRAYPAHGLPSAAPHADVHLPFPAVVGIHPSPRH